PRPCLSCPPRLTQRLKNASTALVQNIACLEPFCALAFFRAFAVTKLIGHFDKYSQFGRRDRDGQAAIFVDTRFVAYPTSNRILHSGNHHIQPSVVRIGINMQLLLGFLCRDQRHSYLPSAPLRAARCQSLDWYVGSSSVSFVAIHRLPL